MDYGQLSQYSKSKTLELVEEALEVFRNTRDRFISQCLVRAALAFLGEAIKRMDSGENIPSTAEYCSSDDFDEVLPILDGITRKIKTALLENERDNVVSYLESFRRTLSYEQGSGSSTPRPRDYDAAISRFSDSFNSPNQQRGSSEQERLEHTHSSSILKH